MVRFACPQCNSVHEFPDQQVGKKVDCPTCGQRLQIPSPKMQMPRNKTVLGSLLAPFVRVKPVPKVATCPVCRQKLKIPEKHIDKATCPTCRTEFLIKPNAPKKTDRLEESPSVRSATAPRQTPAEVSVGPESLEQSASKGEQWYYMRAGKQSGPVSAAELKRMASCGHLSPTDMVWKEGMPNWVSAEKLKGLFAAPVASVPSAPFGSSRAPLATQIVAGPLPPMPASALRVVVHPRPAYEPDEGKRRTGGITAVGVINIIWGLLFVFTCIAVLIVSSRKGEEIAISARSALGHVIINLLQLLFGVGLIIAGIGVLRLASWGRTLSSTVVVQVFQP